jgi:hypothetical protein
VLVEKITVKTVVEEGAPAYIPNHLVA